MASFFDASCPKCGRKFGWRGELKDKPTHCPNVRCGKFVGITQADLDDEKMIDDMRDFLLDRKKAPKLSEIMEKERADKQDLPNG